jgi:hypothetical protein
MASAESPSHCSLSLQVVINGGATSSGEQDNEDTELMAIYTTENGIAEKVPMLPLPTARPCFCRGLGVSVCLFCNGRVIITRF